MRSSSWSTTHFFKSDEPSDKSDELFDKSDKSFDESDELFDKSDEPFDKSDEAFDESDKPSEMSAKLANKPCSVHCGQSADFLSFQIGHFQKSIRANDSDDTKC